MEDIEIANTTWTESGVEALVTTGYTQIVKGNSARKTLILSCPGLWASTVDGWTPCYAQIGYRKGSGIGILCTLSAQEPYKELLFERIGESLRADILGLLIGTGNADNCYWTDVAYNFDATKQIK